MAEDYSKLTVVQIRDLFKARGIPTTGLTRKQQLIDRLVELDTAAASEAAIDATEGEKIQDDVQTTPKAAAEDPEAQVTDAPPSEGEAKDDVKVFAEEANEQKHADADAEFGNTETWEITSIPSKLSPTEDVRKRKRKNSSPQPDDVVSDKKRPRNTTDGNNIEDSLKQEAGVEAAPEISAVEEHDAIKQAVVESQPEQLKESIDESVRAILPDQMHVTEADVRQTPNTATPIHPETRALYVRNLKRPLQPQRLREHLDMVSLPVEPVNDDASNLGNAITTFFIDQVRTHCFVIYNSVAAAARARSALHGKPWPVEMEREALWVDFVPEDKVPDWIEHETSSNEADSRTLNPKKFEITYEVLSNGDVNTSLREADGATTPFSQVRQNSTMSNVGAQSESPVIAFKSLDELFKFTKAKPKLYYQPVSDEVVQKRTIELDKYKSRSTDRDTWSGEMRRYTFEDGHRLVDNGPEFGMRGAMRGRGRRGAPLRGRGAPPRGPGRPTYGELHDFRAPANEYPEPPHDYREPTFDNPPPRREHNESLRDYRDPPREYQDLSRERREYFHGNRSPHGRYDGQFRGHGESKPEFVHHSHGSEGPHHGRRTPLRDLGGPSRGYESPPSRFNGPPRGYDGPSFVPEGAARGPNFHRGPPISREWRGGRSGYRH